jgi:hypothetical protein
VFDVEVAILVGAGIGKHRSKCHVTVSSHICRCHSLRVYPQGYLVPPETR